MHQPGPLFLLLSLLLIAACRQPQTTAATPATAATMPAAPPVPTSTPSPSPQPTPQPGATPTLPAGDFPTFVPPATSQPASATPPAPTPDSSLPINPLTGLPFPDPALAARRPLAIKIANAPAKWVRPQSGLSQADLVFEHVAEGNLTRFTAIFYSQTPPDVGPVRSARLIDLELPAMYDAALAYSGASIGLSRRLIHSDFAARLLRSHENGFYRTGAARPWEHTLYAHPEGLWQALAEKGENRPPTFQGQMAFSQEPPPGGQPVSSIHLRYGPEATVDWSYDADRGLYWRRADGEPQDDANNHAGISAANVVILFANHVTDASICENQGETTCLDYAVEIQLWGQGEAWLLRDGRLYAGTWHRAARADLLTFTGPDGQPLPLRPGQTWFQLFPAGSAAQITTLP